MDISLVGKCGLYCGACSVYRGQRDDDESRNRIARNAKCSEDKVRCNGCGDLTNECWGYGCKLVVCSRTKGLNYCFECIEYQNNACAKHDKLSKAYLEIGVDLRENLRKIESGLTEEWLKESAEKFKCSNCGQPISAWAETCHKCGHNLR